MPKDDRKILRGIRPSIPKGAAKTERTVKTFVDGMEDELAAAFSQLELDAMIERGDLAGTWKHIAPKKVEATKEK